MTFNYKQWNLVAVPLLQQQNTSTWRGTLGELGEVLYLVQDVYGPGGSIVFQAGATLGDQPYTSERVGRLYGCDFGYLQRLNGKTAQYLEQLAAEVLALSQTQGW